MKNYFLNFKFFEIESALHFPRHAADRRQYVSSRQFYASFNNLIRASLSRAEFLAVYLRERKTSGSFSFFFEFFARRVIRISSRELSKVFRDLASLGLPISPKFRTMEAAPFVFLAACCDCKDMSNFLWRKRGVELNLKSEFHRIISVITAIVHKIYVKFE